MITIVPQLICTLKSLVTSMLLQVFDCIWLLELIFSKALMRQLVYFIVDYVGFEETHD